MTRTEQPPTTTPPHSPEKKKKVYSSDRCLFFSSPTISSHSLLILSSVTGVLFTFLKPRVRPDQYCFEVHCWTVFET